MKKLTTILTIMTAVLFISTGGGGTGYSSTSSELITLPWLTVQVIKYVD